MTHIDEETGQLMRLRSLAPRLKRETVPFVMVYQGTRFDDLIFDQTLTISEARLFLYLIGTTPWNECQQINQSGVGEELGMNRVTVNKALKGLVERGVVLKDAKRRDCYRINPEIAHRGDGVERKKRLEELADA